MIDHPDDLVAKERAAIEKGRERVAHAKILLAGFQTEFWAALRLLWDAERQRRIGALVYGAKDDDADRGWIRALEWVLRTPEREASEVESLLVKIQEAEGRLEDYR
jgi:hypothetical protein